MSRSPRRRRCPRERRRGDQRVGPQPSRRRATSTGATEIAIGRTCRKPRRGVSFGGSVSGELDLDLGAGRVLADGQQRPNRLVDRKLLAHEQRGEVEDARPRSCRSRDDPVGVRHVRRGSVAQRVVLFRIRERSDGRGTPSRRSGRRAAALPCSRPRTRSGSARGARRRKRTGGGAAGTRESRSRTCRRPRWSCRDRGPGSRPPAPARPGPWGRSSRSAPRRRPSG